MTDLIDRNKLPHYDGTALSAAEVARAVEDAPSAQPEIIRCKDCRQFRRWIGTDITFCDLTESERNALDFCSRAERRTDDGT